jgi:hypothetical protein
MRVGDGGGYVWDLRGRDDRRLIMEAVNCRCMSRGLDASSRLDVRCEYRGNRWVYERLRS